MFEGTFELFNISVRRLVNGNKLSLILEMPESIETEKELIEFRGENVKTTLNQIGNEKNQIEQIFEVFDVKCRRLKNGNKLRLILEQAYEKALDIKLVGLRFDEIHITLELVNPDMFENEEIDDE